MVLHGQAAKRELFTRRATLTAVTLAMSCFVSEGTRSVMKGTKASKNAASANPRYASERSMEQTLHSGNLQKSASPNVRHYPKGALSLIGFFAYQL